MSFTGEPEGHPQKVGVAITDIGAGMWASFAIMTALYYRANGGEGQYIDISMLDGQVAWLTYQAGSFFATGQPPKRWGIAHPALVPCQAFMCKDGKFLNVAVGSERIWERFCQGIGREELAAKPEYAGNPQRLKNRAILVPMLQELFLTAPAGEWDQALQAVSVPCGVINDLADVFSDPQVRHRQMVVEVPHPTLGGIQQTGIPVKFSLTPGVMRRHPPLLGEHNEEILGDLGYSSEEVRHLSEKGII